MSRVKEILKNINEMEMTQNVAKRKQVFTQFIVRDNHFSPMGEITTQSTLDPGIYDVKSTMNGIIFEVHDLKTDEILRFEDSRYNQVLDEISNFWSLKDDFNKMGFTHKRGVLLYGSPGTGKSCLLKLVMEDTVNKGDVVFIAKSSGTLVEGLTQFREVEPERKVLVIIEDIDELVRYNERPILELFDGDSQTDNVLFLGTTNYIERLPGRIIRAGRFDRTIEVKNPPLQGRLAYLKHKLKVNEKDEKITELAKKTENFSFAQLRELLVSVYCLKQGETEVLRRIRNKLEENFISEEELDKRLSKMFENSDSRLKVEENRLIRMFGV
jgi:SpoVK/Ycf46/Vps4 family AAA+-type ATPase